MDTAAIYTRVSTTHQGEDGTSLLSQRQLCLDYAQRNQISVPEHYIYVDVMSGKKTRRPALDKMREAIRAQQVDAVLFWDLDRLMRDQWGFAVVALEMLQHGVASHHVKKGEVLRTSDIAKYMTTVQVFGAEHEREQLMERSQRGVKTRVHDLHRPTVGRKAPYGYRYFGERKEKLVPDEDRVVEGVTVPGSAERMRWIFHRLAAGKSCGVVAKELNELGVPAPSGKPGVKWRDSTLAAMIKNSVYYGEFRAFVRSKDQTTPGKTGWHADKGVLVPDVVKEPLVSHVEWLVVNDRVTSLKSLARKNNCNPEAALLRAGHAVCGYCGGTMTLIPTKRKRLDDGTWENVGLSYRCSPQNRKAHGCPAHTISTTILDTAVWQHCLRVLDDRVEIRRRLEEALGRETPQSIDVALAERQLATITKEEEELQQALMLNLTNQAVLDNLACRLNELGELRQAGEARVAELRAENERVRRREQCMASVLEWCHAVRSTIRDNADYETKREALVALGLRAFVWRADEPDRPRYAIQWSLPFDGQELLVSDQDQVLPFDAFSVRPTKKMV